MNKQEWIKDYFSGLQVNKLPGQCSPQTALISLAAQAKNRESLSTRILGSTNTWKSF